MDFLNPFFQAGDDKEGHRTHICLKGIQFSNKAFTCHQFVQSVQFLKKLWNYAGLLHVRFDCKILLFFQKFCLCTVFFRVKLTFNYYLLILCLNFKCSACHNIILQLAKCIVHVCLFHCLHNPGPKDRSQNMRLGWRLSGF